MRVGRRGRCGKERTSRGGSRTAPTRLAGWEHRLCHAAHQEMTTAAGVAWRRSSTATRTGRSCRRSGTTRRHGGGSGRPLSPNDPSREEASYFPPAHPEKFGDLGDTPRPPAGGAAPCTPGRCMRQCPGGVPKDVRYTRSKIDTVVALAGRGMSGRRGNAGDMDDHADWERTGLALKRRSNS